MRPCGEVTSSSGGGSGGDMSYETDGSSESSPRSHASPPDDAVGSPDQSEASPGPCSSSHPNPGQKARNEAEKHRRDRINRGVNTLCGMVGPAYLTKQQKKIDKITTLRLAANYMRRAFIQCFVASLHDDQKKTSLPLDIIEVIQNFTEDSGFWLTINRRGKVLDATEGIQHLLGYNLVDVANEDLAKFVDPSQSDVLMTEKLLGYPDDCSEMVTKDVTLYMQPKPTGRKDSLRSGGAAVHVRGFMGPIQLLVGTEADPSGALAAPGAETQRRLVPDDEVILVARVTPAGAGVPSLVDSRPENEYFLQVRSDGVIVGSDSRISLCAGFLPSEVRKKSAHSFLHQDDQMWAAVRQGLMFLYPQEFDSVTVRLLTNTNEVGFVNVRVDIATDLKRLPEGHFTTRNILISPEDARRERCEEMQHLKGFLKDVINGKYPREQVQAMVQAIMGPMMGELNTFLDGPTNFSEPFSGEFNMCMFQLLADFWRSLPPPQTAPDWPGSSSGDVQITELDSTSDGSAGPAAAPGPAGDPAGAAGPAAPSSSTAAPPPSHNTAPMEPLCVDTYSASDIPTDDLHTLLSSCSDDQWEEPLAGGPSPAGSELGAAAQPSPATGTFCSPTNGLPAAQYSACAVQSPPQPFQSPPQPFQSPQSCTMPSPQGYAMQSPHSYAAASPQSYASASPAQSYAATSPASYTSASPQSQRYASMSPGQCYASPPGQCFASPPANGQMVSPSYGQPVRQSCQFQPAAAPPSGYQETGMFLSPPMQQPQVVPNYSQHSQELSSRHCMAQQAAMDTGQLGVSDLGALELAVDSLPLLLAQPTSSHPQPPDDALMNWSHG